MPGGELFDHILAHRYLKEKDAAKLFAQLISGVHYLHQKKIVHRDLKLENLLLDKHRNVIITDFGFANRFEHKVDDLMATSCGSPCYAAPELVISEGLYVGSAVDVWSCGVILYAMLSGYLPFDDDPANPDGDNINLLYRYIVNTPLAYPEYLSFEAKDLLAKMLVPDPLHRCDLPAVMNHPWLAAYTPLFSRSVPDLEAIASEQQQHKRMASRREMQSRLRVQEQARMAVLAKNAKMAEAAAAGLPAPRQQGGTTSQQRHQSAMPTLSTVPHNLASYGGEPSRPHEFQRTPTPLVNVTQPVQQAKEESDGRVVRPREEDASDPILQESEARAAARPRPETSVDQDAALPPSEPPKVILPSTSFARPAAPLQQQNDSIPSPTREKRPASQNKNRHTIQVEYDGDATYEKMLAIQEARRAESDNEREVIRNELLALNSDDEPEVLRRSQSQAEQPTITQQTPEIASVTADRMDVDQIQPPRTPPRNQPREDESTPKASRQRSAVVAPSTPTGLGILGTPTEGPRREIETPKAPSKTVLANITSNEDVAQMQTPSTAQTLSPVLAPPQRSASGSTSSSIHEYGSATSHPEANLPTRTLSVSSTEQSSGSPLSAVPSGSAAAPPPVSGKSSTRSRRGMSMDKFGLGKLLGSGNTSTDSVTRPPNSSRDSASSVLHRNPSTRTKTKSAAAKPSLSIQVDPAQRKQ